MKRNTRTPVIGNVVKVGFSALLATVLLAACATFIPDQEVEDPFGLDGLAVRVPFQAKGLTTAAVDGSAQVSFEIDDFDEALPLNPTLISNTLRVASATLDGPLGPEQLTISDVEVNLKVWEGSDGYASASRRASVTLASSATVVLNRSGRCEASPCAYVVGSGNELGKLELRGSELTAFLTLMTTGATTNSGAVSLTLVGNPDDLAGRVLTVHLAAKEGRISFK